MSAGETKPAARPRRPWVAFVLSLLLAGLGQLYCGRVRAASLFLGLELILWLIYIGVATSLWSSPRLLTILTLLLVSGLAINIISLGDAIIGARRATSFAPMWFNRWYFYVALVAVFYAGGGLVAHAGRHSLQAFHVPSGSMAPTIRIGDHILVGLHAYEQQDPRRCDIVVFAQPSTTGSSSRTIFVKRVVALAGDEIQYKQGRLFLNGTVVSRERVSDDSLGTVYREALPDGCSYLILEQSDRGPLDDTVLYKVPPGTVFVLGDDRDDSSDSRVEVIGYVPLERVRGRVLLIYWAKDLSRIGALKN